MFFNTDKPKVLDLIEAGPVAAQEERCEGSEICDPCITLESMMGHCAHLFGRIREKFDVGYEHVERYLRDTEPEIYAALNHMQERIDTDICGRFNSGRLTAEELVRWQNDVAEWKMMLESAVQLFIMKTFGDMIDIQPELISFCQS